MPTKSIKLALLTTGADSALASLTKLAEQKDQLAKGTTIRLTLDQADLTEEKLDAISDQVKTLTDEGANVRVNLVGAGDAEAQLGVLADEQAKLAESGAAVSASFTEQGVASESFGSKASKALTYAAIGIGVVGGVSIKMAADFDQSTSRLVTGAGESASKLNMVREGILGISASTATSASELSTAMYMIESAGFHASDGLEVLKASAEGAKAEGADLTDVANAVTSALNSYHLPASSAVAVTDELVKSVSEGKMTMEQLASSIHSVLPVAAAAGLSLAQVGGAVATMTMQGMSAQQATQDLAHTIQALQNPNSVAVNEMEQLGLKANDVSKNLGKTGLTGTISTLENAILQNMGPSGTVLLKSFNQSQDAAKDLNTMLAAMPPSVQALAKQFMSGSLSMSAFKKEIPTTDTGMLNQFTALYGKVHGFNSELTAGGPAAQTFTAALSKVMGGQTGLNTALMVGGKNMTIFQANVAGVSAAAKGAGKDVTDWSLIQSNFNFKLSQTKDSAEAVAISFGNDLLPAVEDILKPIAAFGVFLANNAIASKSFAVILVTVLAAALGTKLVQGFSAVAEAGAKVVGLFTTQAVAATADAVATDTATESTRAFTLALVTNPITLVIAGLVLLGVAFYELTTHCKAFRDFWIDVWHDIQVSADAVWAWLKANWQLLVASLLSIATGGLSLVALEVYQHWSDITHYTQDLYHDVLSIYNDIQTGIDTAWNTIWTNTISRVTNGISDVVNWFHGLPTRVVNAMGSLKTLLVNDGEQLIDGLFSGAEAILDDVGSWVKVHIFNPIVGAIKSLFGINSPSTVMAGLGGHMVSGLVLGLLKSNPTAMITKIFGSLPAALGSLVEKGVVNIASLPGKALSALSGLGSKLLSVLGLGGKGAAANVQGWLSAALSVTGKPLSWLDPLQILVGKESSGNPTAVDPISVDGQHATGLLQMLPSTFAQYEVPGFTNILNPLDNAISSIRYISAEYGSPMNIPGLEGGSYVGYDQGGWLMPGYHMVANLTGKPEQVIPAGGAGGAGSGVTVNIYPHPSNNPDEIYEQVWQGLRNLRTHRGNQPLGLG